jgi:hypothetical protein
MVKYRFVNASASDGGHAPRAVGAKPSLRFGWRAEEGCRQPAYTERVRPPKIENQSKLVGQSPATPTKAVFRVRTKHQNLCGS